MKLAEKTTRIYLALTAILLLCAGSLLYILMTDFIDEEVTEKLMINMLRVVNRLEQGQVVTELPPIIEVEELSTPRAETIITKDTVLYDTIEQEAEDFREVTAFETINNKTYRITLRQVILQPHDYYSTIGLSLLLVMTLLLIGLVLINRRISQKLWHPFYHNLEKLKQFSLQENQPIGLRTSSISEFQELNQTLERMTDKLRTDYRALKQFAENASHEMQTPLAIIQTKLDEALQSPALSEEQARQIKAAYASTLRLSRLNQSLLLLTRIQNRQFTATQAIALTNTIEQYLKEYEDFLTARKITVEKHLEAGTVISAHPAIVDTLLTNLIGNAIRHNIDGGTINLRLEDKTLTIANTGLPLSIPPSKLFERFAKDDPSSDSPGLGLAIVRSICDTNGWTISYTAENRWHTIRVTF
jgi:signal transduction histidine kinase